MTKAQMHAAIIRIQSEQIALYPDIPESYYQLYRPKPREPAQTGDNPTLTEPAKRDIFCMIGRKLARIAKKILRRIRK